jgi:hypothetical protein
MGFEPRTSGDITRKTPFFSVVVETMGVQKLSSFWEKRETVAS